MCRGKHLSNAHNGPRDCPSGAARASRPGPSHTHTSDNNIKSEGGIAFQLRAANKGHYEWLLSPQNQNNHHANRMATPKTAMHQEEMRSGPDQMRPQNTANACIMTRLSLGLILNAILGIGKLECKIRPICPLVTSLLHSPSLGLCGQQWRGLFAAPFIGHRPTIIVMRWCGEEMRTA